MILKKTHKIILQSLLKIKHSFFQYPNHERTLKFRNMGLLAIVKFGSNPSSSNRQNGITSVVWSIEFIQKNQQFCFFLIFQSYRTAGSISLKEN